MFHRYTDAARRVLAFAREEAGKIGSECIDSEHLLLGVMRAVEPQLLIQLGLQNLQGVLRKEAGGSPHQALTESTVDLPLSNQNKRILAYAAEEAFRLDSR